ncbi:14069_t:CDS:2, partial [Racocetra persica]
LIIQGEQPARGTGNRAMTSTGKIAKVVDIPDSKVVSHVISQYFWIMQKFKNLIVMIRIRKYGITFDET